MNWEDIIGQDDLKAQLKQSIADNRVGHALLFTGDEGFGVLPLILAFCREILAKNNPNAGQKVDHLNHLDLHFSFPAYTVDKKILSKNFTQEFRNLVLHNPYFSFNDWATELNSETKQFLISVDEVSDISDKLFLKSFEGGYKIMIVWHAEKMNIQAANKFLKLLEEPPEKTIIILTAERRDSFLETIISRTQSYDVPRIKDEDIRKAILKQHQLSDSKLESVIYQAQGNWNTACQIIESGNPEEEFEDYFIKWVRDAFMVKKNPSKLKEILQWSNDIASWNKEKQKSFLDYCSEAFRLALLQNYSVDGLVYKKVGEGKLKWEKFAEYIHGANIEDILKEISEANTHITRNGNAKIVWADMGIKLSRYIHRSPN